jgi:hypothetical protein
MPAKKTYAVVLNELGAAELEKVFVLWIKREELGVYLNASAVDPNGPFVTMTLISTFPDKKTVEFEVQIPHSYVRAIVYAADIKRIGFVAL